MPEWSFEVPAILSPCRNYRYLLTRRVSYLSELICLFTMLNPSTADESKDDPSIRRCMGFARAWGYGILLVANLFALRSTDPRLLLQTEDPVGPENDYWLIEAATHTDIAVAAWGNYGSLRGRSNAVCTMLRKANVQLMNLGLTGKGEPKHPLYLPASAELALHA